MAQCTYIDTIIKLGFVRSCDDHSIDYNLSQFINFHKGVSLERVNDLTLALDKTYSINDDNYVSIYMALEIIVLRLLNHLRLTSDYYKEATILRTGSLANGCGKCCRFPS